MTKLDTIELTTSADYIQSLDTAKFTRSNITKSNGKSIINYSLDKKSTGIHRVSVNKTHNKVKFKISSKILGLNYSKGISLETIEEVVMQVNKNGIILRPEFINDCILNSVDVKNDLELSLMPYNYIQSLNHLIAPKFTKARYPSGISFNENIQQNAIRQTVYDKGFEMQKNKNFYKEFPSLTKEFEKTLRIESRLSSRATIRKYFKSNNLIEVLDSSNLNYIILNKIIDNQTKINSVLKTQEMNNSQEKNFTQVYYLNDIYNGDFSSIMTHIKGKLSANTKPSYQRKQVKKYLAMINNAKDQDSMQNIKEIQNALKER